MVTPDKKKVLTPSLISAVNSYLMAKAHAELLHDQVDAIFAKALQLYPIYKDLVANSRRFGDGSQIIHSKDMYLSQDKQTSDKIYAFVNEHCRKLGIKPDSMSDELCPALVADSLVRECKRLIIQISAPNMDVDPELVLNGSMEHYNKWVDIHVSMVVSDPDYKNPLPRHPG